MKFIPSLGEFSTKGKAAFQRFSITLSWAIIGTLFMLFAIENDLLNQTFTTNILLTFVLGVSWLIATRFFIEQFDPLKEWIIIIPILLLGLFLWHLPSTEIKNAMYWMRFLLYLFGGHLFVFVAPFVLKWHKQSYSNYLKSIFVAIVRSAFFSLILYLGITLALLAFDNLFNVKIDGKRYFQIFVICVGIVNTWIYLSDFPKNIYDKTKLDYNKALEVFVKYILIPLVILYLIILYAYGFKILLQWDLPKGWVSYLVIALSFLGFVIQILINPVQKTIDSRAIKKFYPWFYRLLLPLIVLLFVAIFRRIIEYGFTENRYFVLVLACWILGITGYILFSKNKQIRVIPLSLSLITLLVSFGFWGAFSVSSKSQLHRFENLFATMKSKDFTITFKEKQQFNSIIRYFGEKNEIDKLSTTLGYNPVDEFDTNSYWDLQRKISDSLHFEVLKSDDIEAVLGKRKFFYIENENQFEIHIEGYDYLKRIFINNRSKNNKINGWIFTFKDMTMNINKDSINYQVPLTNFVESLRNSSENVVSKERMTLSKEFEKLKVKFVFTNLSFINTNTLQNINTYVLIKEK